MQEINNFFSTTRQEFTAKHKLIHTSNEQQPCILFHVCWVLQGKIRKALLFCSSSFPWENIARHLIPGIFIVSITQMVLCMQLVSLKWSVMQLALMLAKAL